jgi:hypothetical protein
MHLSSSTSVRASASSIVMRFTSVVRSRLKRAAARREPVIAVLDQDAKMIGRAIAGVQVLGAPHELDAIISEFALYGGRDRSRCDRRRGRLLEPCSPARDQADLQKSGSAQMSASVFHPSSGRPDCVAGVVGLELRNVVTNIPLKGRTDFRRSSRGPAQRLFAFELRRSRCAARGPQTRLWESGCSDSTSVNHAVVAELLHGARRERGFYGGLYGTRVTALMTGHACLRRNHRRTRKTVICAGRALTN